MNLNEILLPEFEQEMNTTKNVLNELSDDFFSFQPHEKSMNTQELANHIAEIPTWVNGTLEQEELDFATANYTPANFESKQEVIDFFEKNVEAAKQSLQNTTNEKMLANWSLRNGDQIYFTMPRAAVLRTMVMSHIIHHRAQLGVYLRMNEAKVPASYGRSADDMGMM